METDVIKQMIENGLPGAMVNVGGDGTHFQALVVCDGFAGRTMLQRHRMVYQTLGEKMGREIHALSIRALTGDEWQKLSEPGISG